MLMYAPNLGKTLFLCSLAGETKLLSGSFTPPAAGTALCDQVVWLRNATIQENIIAEDELDEGWYSRVLSACGLVQDLNEMKRGDQTLIGSQGISLSGGQKNRLALARALYSRKPILIVDDMLAGLDNTTEKLVFDRVFGPNGLLRKSNATVVLATHATYYARYADRIMIFSKGKVASKGTFQQLLDRNVDFQASNQSACNGNSEPMLANLIVADVDGSAKPTGQHTTTREEVDEEEDAARRSGDKQSLLFFLKVIGPLHVSIYWGLLVVATVATQIQCKYLHMNIRLVFPYPECISPVSMTSVHVYKSCLSLPKQFAHSFIVLWLKWWAESDDSSKSASIRNLYIFVVITIINVVLYFIYLASVNINIISGHMLMERTVILRCGSYPN
jgi:ATP-binding cassette subfamily C (CFTR/MRP) protein 1